MSACVHPAVVADEPGYWRCGSCDHPFVPLRQTHCVHGKLLYDEHCDPCMTEAVAAETLRDPDAYVVTVFKKIPRSSEIH